MTTGTIITALLAVLMLVLYRLSPPRFRLPAKEDILGTPDRFSRSLARVLSVMDDFSEEGGELYVRLSKAIEDASDDQVVTLKNGPVTLWVFKAERGYLLRGKNGLFVSYDEINQYHRWDNVEFTPITAQDAYRLWREMKDYEQEEENPPEPR